MADTAQSPLRKRVEARLGGLVTERYSWLVHWRELAEYILPRRYRWLVTANQNRGQPLNTAIIDSTGTIAARTLASGMMAGTTSPAKPWFRLSIDGYDADESSPVAIWLSECEARMMRVFSESNFYNAMATMLFDLVVFGTAVVLIYEDYDNVICCYNPCAGEYFLANSSKLNVDTIYRQFTRTTQQTVEEFGIDNVSEGVRKQYEDGTGSTKEVVIAHAIEPNEPAMEGLNKRFKWREVYWEYGNSQADGFLRKKGYFEFPGLCPRWDLSSNDAYGRSPAMDALGDIKQLQQEQRRKAQALDKMVNPPMVADVQLKNQPASLLPGGVTYITGMAQGKKGFEPVYQINFPIQEITKDIAEVQQRIQRIFFNDIFMMFQNMEAEPRSAAAVDVRREEKLVMLGPVLERIQNEAHDPAIDRVFAIMDRAQLLPPPPAEIAALPTAIRVDYVSMLAEAQKASATNGIERLLAIVGNLGAVQPEAYDKLNTDYTIDKYSELLANDPRLLNDDKTVAGLRAARAKQQQAQQGAMAVSGGADTAKVLSDTKLGGGASALDLMVGGQGGMIQ